MSLRNKRIFVSALNWGIGHASRCVPLIHALIDAGAKVTLGSDGSAAAFLEKEIPEVPVLEMPGKEIRYGKKGVSAALLPQLPNFFKQIKKDHQFVERLIAINPMDLIISDNRYGCYHKDIPSALITHQLNIQAPKIAKPLIDNTMRSWCSNFSEVWIPDNKNGLAGKLAVGKYSLPVKYLGPLSRIKKVVVEEKIPLLILLSGPEPQRSILEEKIWMEIKDFAMRIVLVRGTNKKHNYAERTNIKILDLINSQQLNPLLNAADRIICRSGYSSLMDLAQLEKSALLIPTPGQSEQEYLGKYYQKKNWATVQKQGEINILRFLAEKEAPKLPIATMLIKKWLPAIESLIS